MCNYETHMKHTNTKPSRKALLAQIYAEFLHKASLITLKLQNKAKQRTTKAHTIFCS